METHNDLILVPFDFTPLSYQALEHGACLAKSMNQKLLILHISGKDKDIPSLEKKLQFIVEDCVEEYGIQPDVTIRKGTRTYAAIKNVALELNPKLVILKTGGVRGIKRYTGIRTIKILSGTVIPFVVIQDAPKNSMLQNMVFPINFLGEHDTKLQRVVYFSQFYPDATMHIITPSGKGTEKEKIIADNIKVMTQDEHIKVNFITHDKNKNKAEDIIAIAKEVDSDMIMIPTETVPTITKFLFGLREEKLISNVEKIPVLCVHSSTSIL
jgi:nucleotide-binding universal stress UspA family protein